MNRVSDAMRRAGQALQDVDLSIEELSFAPSEESPAGLRPRLEVVTEKSHFFTRGLSLDHRSHYPSETLVAALQRDGPCRFFE